MDGSSANNDIGDGRHENNKELDKMESTTRCMAKRQRRKKILPSTMTTMMMTTMMMTTMMMGTMGMMMMTGRRLVKVDLGQVADGGGEEGVRNGLR